MCSALVQSLVCLGGGPCTRTELWFRSPTFDETSMSILLHNNPAIELLAQRREAVLRTRRRLCMRMDAIVPRSSEAVELLIHQRSVGSDIPPVGELWPWLLADLAGIPEARIRREAEAWLALYLYSAVLDDALDELGTPQTINPIAASLLFQLGLSDLMALSAGTRWARVITDSANRAIRYQAADVRLRTTRGNLRAKRQASAGKNTGYMAIAAAIGLGGRVDPSPLVQFSKRVLLALQHLDDIGDFEADYRSENFTPLLSSWALKDQGESVDGLSRYDLLERLILTGALETTLRETLDLIGSGRRRLERSYEYEDPKSAGLDFIEKIEAGLEAAVKECEYAGTVLRGVEVSPTRRRSSIRAVERRIIVVAQQS